MPKISTDLHDRLSHVRLLAMDVDGVLTDGGVYILESGEEFRRFDIKDGLGLKRVIATGIHIVWISAGKCESVRKRATNLGIMHVYLGIDEKMSILEHFCQNKAIRLDSVAYIGDDLTDLQVLQSVGVAFAPADAINQIKEIANYVTSRRGGCGAVREVCDILLASLLGK